jgi:hypothetical protein
MLIVWNDVTLVSCPHDWCLLHEMTWLSSRVQDHTVRGAGRWQQEAAREATFRRLLHVRLGPPQSPDRHHCRCGRSGSVTSHTEAGYGRPLLLVLKWVIQTHPLLLVLKWVIQTHPLLLVLKWVTQTHPLLLVLKWVTQTHPLTVTAVARSTVAGHDRHNFQILTVNYTFCFATIDKVFYYVASVLTTCFGPYIRPSSCEFTKYWKGSTVHTADPLCWIVYVKMKCFSLY